MRHILYEKTGFWWRFPLGPVSLVGVNTALDRIEDRPVAAAHLEGLALPAVHVVGAAHLHGR